MGDHCDKTQAWDGTQASWRKGFKADQENILQKFLNKHHPEAAAAEMRERAAKLAEQPPHWPSGSGKLTDHIAEAIRALPIDPETGVADE